MKKFFFITLVFISVLFVVSLNVKADIDEEIKTISSQIEELNNNLKQKQANYQKINQRINAIKNKITLLGNEVVKKEEEVRKGEEALSYQKKLLNERVRSYYKNVNKSSLSLISLFVAQNLNLSLENFFYQKSVVDKDKQTIVKIILYIKDLEETKKRLIEEKGQLAYFKKVIDRQAQSISGEISTTKEKISQLKARQRSLISQRQASLNISRSAATLGRCDSDLTNGRNPGFSPRFAVFTYGVPNRVGMNQYGAYGRAKAGQNSEQILNAYYGGFQLKKDYDTGINISVNGYGSFNIEDYVKRIYEIPNSWGGDGFEALKAQAVAARSYALAYTDNGKGSICSTEHCQVFKPDPKGGDWERAVDETKGWVMIKDGNPIKAWFSSTHGGYIFKTSEIGWSGTSWTKHANDFDGSVNSFSDLNAKAFDKDSPWFYCDWGWRSQYDKTAWLRSSELADIVNSLMLSNKDPSTGAHLYQTDKPHPYGGEIWDENKVKEELKNRGITPFNSVSNANVSVDFGYGKTNQVNVSGDGGNKSFSAVDFKTQFNLRAPANIQIVGPLYNIEKR